MKLVSAIIVILGMALTLSAQTPALPSAPLTAGAPTNQVATTNQVDTAVVQQLLQRLDTIQEQADRDKAEADRLGEKLVVASQRIDQIRDAEASSRSTMFTVMFFVIGLAAISIIGLVSFCFYTLRRLTQLGEPIFDNFHKSHHLTLPHGTHVGMLQHPTLPPQMQEMQPNALAHAGETRLLDAVDRLERKIVEMEKIAHHENNHLDTTTHAPVIPVAPIVNGATSPPPSHSAATEPQPMPSFRQADRLVLLMNKGEAHTNLGQFDRAVDCFEQAILLAPTDPAPVVKKGYALEKAGKLDDAVHCYDQAINLDPNFSMAYLFKGGVCNRLQRYNEAIDCYDRALAVRSNQPS